VLELTFAKWLHAGIDFCEKKICEIRTSGRRHPGKGDDGTRLEDGCTGNDAWLEHRYALLYVYLIVYLWERLHSTSLSPEP